jgi:hypothetical protein
MKNRTGNIIGVLLAGIISVTPVMAQQRKASDAQKKKEKVERSYNKAYAKARKKTIKHRREIQTDETRKRMDATDKRARVNNKMNEPGFFDRNFKRKKPPKK